MSGRGIMNISRRNMRIARSACGATLVVGLMLIGPTRVASGAPLAVSDVDPTASTVSIAPAGGAETYANSRIRYSVAGSNPAARQLLLCAAEHRGVVSTDTLCHQSSATTSK